VLIDLQGYLRITDFGLSKANIYDSTAKSICGTPEYLAPEILKKSGHGKPVDWWALGSIIYELYTGNPAFQCKSRNELFKQIKDSPVMIPKAMSPELKDLLSKLFVKDPNYRLGAKFGAIEVKSHPWYARVDWDAIYNKRIIAPYVPKLEHDSDISYFDVQFTSQDPESYTCSKSGKFFSQFSFNGF